MYDVCKIGLRNFAFKEVNIYILHVSHGKKIFTKSLDDLKMNGYILKFRNLKKQTKKSPFCCCITATAHVNIKNILI